MSEEDKQKERIHVRIQNKLLQQYEFIKKKTTMKLVKKS